MCSKPEQICEEVLNHILSSLAKKQSESPDFNLPNYILIRFCQMCGYIALKHLEFMDDTVYKELKRRNFIRDERKKEKDTVTSSKPKKKKNMGTRSISASTVSEATLMNTSMVSKLQLCINFVLFYD